MSGTERDERRDRRPTDGLVRIGAWPPITAVRALSAVADARALVRKAMALAAEAEDSEILHDLDDLHVMIERIRRRHHRIAIDAIARIGTARSEDGQ